MHGISDISSFPAYLLAVLLGLALIVNVRHDISKLVSGRNVVLLGIGAWYLLEALMLPEALLAAYTQEQYNVGVFHVALAFAGFLAGYHLTSGCSVFPSISEKISFFDDPKWMWRLVVVGAFIGFAPVIYNTGTQVAEMFQGMMGMRSTWGGLLGRGRYGDARAAFLMLEMFVGGVAPFAAILLLSRESSIVQRAFCSLVIIWPILRAWGSGTRSSLILAAGSTIGAVIYWKAGPALRKKLICAALACAPLLYVVMAAIVESRGSGTFAWENHEKADYVGNEMFRELLFITSKVPAEASYQWGYVYYVQLVNPIPRFLWPDKPTLDSGLWLAGLYGAVDASGEAHLTISPGIIGEMYLNFGVIGIVGLSLFGGWLVKGWDLIVQKHAQSLSTLMFYSGGLGVLFIMGRSFTMNMFYGLLSLALLAWVMSSFRQRPAVAVASTQGV